MSIENTTKINLLLQSQPKGIVFTSQWMAKNGYSPQLQRRYREYNWFESIGAGAMVRTGDQVSLEGAVYSLQRQLGLDVHIGGKSSLGLHGKAHYLNMHQKISLFSPLKENLPRWFHNYEGWKNKYTFTQTDFLPRDIGKLGMSYQGYEIRISSVSRAIMERLYLAPKEQSLIECYEIMEGLNNLRPQVVQELLEKCNSVKVKRLFLYMADKAGHSWFKYLQVDKIDTGTGKRSIVEHGVYNAKYQIIIPKELEKNERGI